MTTESLSVLLEDFLGGSRHASVLEDGAGIFDLADSKYSVSGEYNKCLLHFWSAERNAVRRVLDPEVRDGNIRLMVLPLGQMRLSKLEIVQRQDHRPPTARRLVRAVDQQHLRRALERHLPGFAIAKLSNALDLERPFGPRQGRTAFALLGVNQNETQSSIDAALTFGMLWLDACRHSADPRTLREGLKLFLPTGTSALTRTAWPGVRPRPRQPRTSPLPQRPGDCLRCRRRTTCSRRPQRPGFR
ncbi:MAG TPA: hypothetical protein VNY29_15515 [Terriglobales bacterium]|jgi:hypothetical protein|nr:hypothetical protein [Terriglobales bacterium]